MVTPDEAARRVSVAYWRHAWFIVALCGESPETSVALRNLRISKDSAVIAVLQAEGVIGDPIVPEDPGSLGSMK